MKLNHLMLLLVGLLITTAAHSQETRFFVPKEIQKAYEAGTRAWNGAPGSEYWQNTVDYDIEVRVDPASRLIDGAETVTYYNNSPDELTTLVVRLYFDVFRKANARASRVNPEDIVEGGTQIDRLTINGEEMDLESRQVRRFGTNLYITLPEPLKPGASLEMETEWEQYVPLTNRRTGAADSTTFFLAYWYPQVAVYDDVFGWDDLNFDLRTEFYNNLGNFDVRITAPTNFVVWATGELQNAEAIFPENILERYQKAQSSEETVLILGKEDLTDGYANNSGTWHYTADEVTDFAFGMSDHYAWDAAVQPVEDRQVLVSSVYPANQSAQYTELTSIQQKSMKHLSEDFPGIPYPYPAFTTFIGLQGGGMEFPMMAYNYGPGLGVTIHEMYHTYFPMYVRINEKRFAWMDEGWASYVDDLVAKRYFENNFEPSFKSHTSGVQGNIGSLEDLPLITSSQFMDGNNYGYASYPLPAFVYGVLHHHLGEETFLKAYQTYIRRWAKKSPTPYDFFYTFEDVSGEDLSWLWEPWFFSYGAPDVSIAAYKNGKLTVQNKGTRPVPVQIKATYQDSTVFEEILSAAEWKDKKEIKFKVPDSKNIANLVVNQAVPDVEPMDNFSPSLQERYKQFDLPQDLDGSYTVQNYNLKAYVERENNMYSLRVPAAGMDAILLPTAVDRFQSLDGSMLMEVQQNDDGTVGGFLMDVKTWGITFQVNKDE